MKLRKSKENQDKALSKYTKRLIKLIRNTAGLNRNVDNFYYLDIFFGREYFLNQDTVYVTTYGGWTYDVMENETDSINLIDLYSVKLLKEYPKTIDDIEFETILKNEKYSYSKNDFLTWIDEPSEIIKSVDLPYYRIIQVLLDKKLPNRKTPMARLIKQTLKPDSILHEWSCCRIFCQPDKFTNIWVYDFPKEFEEPYFFLTDSPYLRYTTKIAVLDFKTPTYRKKDYDKGIYKRENVKRKLWKLDEDYIKELIEFLKSPADVDPLMYKGNLQKYAKTKWQEMIFEYNHNSAGWGWDETGFSIPPEKDTNRHSDVEALSFDLPIPDYTKLAIDDAEELSNYAKELMRPENLAGPFNTTEELMEWLEED